MLCVFSHAIWREVRSIGAFCLVVYFNDEQSNNTYMEPVTSCPGCGRGLADHVVIEEGARRFRECIDPYCAQPHLKERCLPLAPPAHLRPKGSP
jgi:hypothetical protein